LRIDALSQQTAYTLPYGERFKIGGDRLGRGFEVAEIAGDQGMKNILINVVALLFSGLQQTG
jgi:hemolysin activation/secretion protein